MTHRPVTRWLGAAALLVIGFLTGIASVAVHRSWWGWLLALLASVALLHALAAGLSRRGAAMIGWILAIGVVLLGRPEGDYAIAVDLPGLGLLAVAFGLMVYALATLPRRVP